MVLSPDQQYSQAKVRGQRHSVSSKNRTDRQTDGGDCIISLTNAVRNNHLSLQQYFQQHIKPNTGVHNLSDIVLTRYKTQATSFMTMYDTNKQVHTDTIDVNYT